MKGIANQMGGLSQGQIAAFEKNGMIVFDVDGQEVTVDVADVDIVSEDIPGWLVANEGNLTVALEIELTEDLKREGMARELINRIQNMRKDNSFEITDRINITVSPNEAVIKAIDSYGEYINGQVLADSITVADNDGCEVDFDEFKLNIKIDRVNN